MSFITGGQITLVTTAWGVWRLRGVDFGETVAAVVDVSGTDSINYRETLPPDLADLNEVTCLILLDDQVAAAPVPLLHEVKESVLTFTIGAGATIVGNGQGLRTRTGVFEINREVVGAFSFRWKAPPQWTPAP